YGVLAALTTLLQTRQMLARGTSCEVSGRFFASYAGGYAIWLVYGLSTGNLPLITFVAVGLRRAGPTLPRRLDPTVSLIHPTHLANLHRSRQPKARRPPRPKEPSRPTEAAGTGSANW